MYILLIFATFVVLGATEFSLTKIGNKTYYISPNKDTMFLGFEFCRRIGMQLLAISDEQEYNEIVNYLTNSTGFWTSGTNYGRKATWVWLSTGAPVTCFWSSETFYDENWDNCLNIVPHSSAYYHAVRCDIENYVVCQETNQIC